MNEAKLNNLVGFVFFALGLYSAYYIDNTKAFALLMLAIVFFLHAKILVLESKIKPPTTTGE